MSELRSDTITASDGTSPVTLTKQEASKARVNANGDTPVINGSFNVSSLTDNANGNFDFNVTNSFSNANFSTAASSHNSGASFGTSPYTGGKTTTSFKIQTANTGGTSADHDIMDGIVQGDLA